MPAIEDEHNKTRGPSRVVALVTSAFILQVAVVLVCVWALSGPHESLSAGIKAVAQARPNNSKVALSRGDEPSLLGRKAGVVTLVVTDEARRALLLSTLRELLQSATQHRTKYFASSRIDVSTPTGNVSILLAGDAFGFALLEDPDVWYGGAAFVHVVFGCLYLAESGSCQDIYRSTTHWVSQMKYDDAWRSQLGVELEALAHVVWALERDPTLQFPGFWDVTGLERSRFSN